MTLSGADGRRRSGTAPVELKVATESADAGCCCGSGGVHRAAGFSIILPAGEASGLPLSVGILFFFWGRGAKLGKTDTDCSTAGKLQQPLCQEHWWFHVVGQSEVGVMSHSSGHLLGKARQALPTVSHLIAHFAIFLRLSQLRFQQRACINDHAVGYRP